MLRLILLATFIATIGAAQAQNPSADQIIRSLQPGGGMLGGTRGIRPVAPADPAVPPAAPAPSSTGAVRPAAPRPVARPAPGPAPAAADAVPSVNLNVQFASNSAELTPAAVRTLSELGRALSSASLASYRFRIEGHTDTVGAPELNRSLSERRAQAVAAFLSSRFGVATTRLEPVGLGQDGLLVQTQPGVAEPRNRRVQVINLGS